jgi:hypothetical protein
MSLDFIDLLERDIKLASFGDELTKQRGMSPLEAVAFASSEVPEEMKAVLADQEKLSAIAFNSVKVVCESIDRGEILFTTDEAANNLFVLHLITICSNFDFIVKELQEKDKKTKH